MQIFQAVLRIFFMFVAMHKSPKSFLCNNVCKKENVSKNGILAKFFVKNVDWYTGFVSAAENLSVNARLCLCERLLLEERLCRIIILLPNKIIIQKGGGEV